MLNLSSVLYAYIKETYDQVTHYSEKRGYFSNPPKSYAKNCEQNNLGHEKIKKLLLGTYILIYVLWNQ